VRIDARRLLFGVLIAGVAGGFMFLPALVYVGSFLSPSQIVPASAHVPPLLGEALWARAGGGTDSQLRPINPFTLARMAGCHILAETTNDDQTQRDAQHDECMKLMPGVEAVGYVSTLHLQSMGVWQDPRVPFVQIATMTKMSDHWTRAELVDTLAERAEFASGIRGVDQASRAYFGTTASELTVAQAALLAGMAGNRRLDPWCDPASAAKVRQRMLTRMLDNRAIDDATFEAADRSDLGLAVSPPEGHRPCRD
jgi:hypothetical protein